jgi:uncharacterized protein (TIGR01777 family)
MPPSEAVSTPDAVPRTIAISGSTGLIGSALVAELRREGRRVRRLVRSAGDREADDIVWDPRGAVLEPSALHGVDAVVHLAGEPVGERWSGGKKERIRRSRVDGTTLVARTLAAMSQPPGVLVSASAVGIYGDRGAEELDETSALGSDFLAGVGREWEAAADPARAAGIRVVHPRFGVVLSPGGGALGKLLPPFKLGLGGKLGSGRQWVSWIGLHDTIRALVFLLDTPGMEGPVNVVAPSPVTNATLTEAVGHAVGRPTIATVPEFALRLAMGEMADATLLASQRSLPRRLLDAGFRFDHPGIEEAVEAELA